MVHWYNDNNIIGHCLVIADGDNEHDHYCYFVTTVVKLGVLLVNSDYSHAL